MKRHIALGAVLTCLLFTAQQARADTVVVVSDTGPRPGNENLLLINPGDLFNGVVSMEYERALTSFFGLTAGFSAMAFNGPFNFGQPSHTIIGPEVGARFHFIQRAPAGLWVGPTLQAGYIVTRNDGVARAFSWGLGAAVGYNFIIGRHFALQLGLGGGFNDYGNALVWAPRLRLGIGAAF